ncbi:MAG: hypothetical protein R3C02_04360 [Planctomycetaceae bacterium]
MKHASEHRDPPAPWPLALGFLAASLTTLLGCIAGHDPETILRRCVVSSVVVSCVGMFVRSAWRFVTTHDEL